ncbi:MAG: hypothetical protein IJO64_07110 [Clostridia bacterium]|nr:hypothetical protein [Clostridia bacterium]
MINSIFSFYISKSNTEQRGMPIKNRLGEYFLHTDENTPLDISVSGNRTCAVFGYAVDLANEKSGKIAEHILKSTSSLSEVLAAEYNLGGKYVLIYQDETGCYVLGDATCSVPIYYTVAGTELVCTSNPLRIINGQKLTPDAKLLRIRKSGNISQAMPFDLTEYSEIKQLIPNHYLSLENQTAKRMINSTEKQRRLSIEEATERAKPLIKALAGFYTNTFKVYCPITSGRDSRVVLAFLSSLSESDVDSYTIKHKEHSGTEQDLVIPKQLGTVCGMHYEQIEDEQVAPETVEYMNAYHGEGRYSPRTLNIANTIHSHYSDGAVINGDIIGQVGKCSLHRDIPRIFATAGYFRCKLHNYSRESKAALKSWLKDIKEGKEAVNTFDLFSVENRMGRWAAQENAIYNSIGQLYLNIFNSRSIIYIWTAVSRKQRKKSLVHIGLIETVCPKLLKVPFEKDESALVRLSKHNGLFYYLSSYLKYYIERRRFREEKQ